MTTILPDELPIPTSPNLISVFLTFPSQAETQGRINVEGLLNTGCLAGDFVARRIVDIAFNQSYNPLQNLLFVVNLMTHCYRLRYIARMYITFLLPHTLSLRDKFSM